MLHFKNFFEYTRFAGASGFQYENAQKFTYSPNTIEKLGNYLIQPLEIPVNFFVTNIRKPLFVVATTMVALFFTAAFYYPSTAGKILTFVAKKIKFPSYLFIQIQIAAFCIRTVGRLYNDELMDEWKKGNLITLPFARG